MDTTIYTDASKILWSDISTISLHIVENVVNAPQNPADAPKMMSLSILYFFGANDINTPIIKHPITFIISVPNGKLPPFNPLCDNIYRAIAPKNPPMLIKTTFLMYTPPI